MIALLTATVALQGSGLFAPTFPNPTGNNGWEEYLMAIDIVSRPDANRLINYQFYLEPKMQGNISMDREVLKTLGRACDLIRVGNSKPLRALPFGEDDDRGFEVMGGSRSISRLFAIEARVRFADGGPDSGVDSIIDAMTFSGRVGRGTLVDALIEAGFNGVALGSIEKALPKLSLAGARKLAGFLELSARSPSPLLMALKVEIREKADAPLPYLTEISEESDYWSPPPELLALTAVQQRAYAEKVGAEFEKLWRTVDGLLGQEERFGKLTSGHNDPIIVYATNTIIYTHLPTAAARFRTQLRLAGLHCRVIEFKRTHNRWPKALAELGGREVWYDPASGGPFFYELLTDQSYILYSLGTPETGRIDLSYRGPTK